MLKCLKLLFLPHFDGFILNETIEYAEDCVGLLGRQSPSEWYK